MDTQIVNGSVQSITQAVREVETALYQINGLSIRVNILDARKVWGRVDLLIEPVNGSGQVWVAQTQVRVEAVSKLTINQEG